MLIKRKEGRTERGSLLAGLQASGADRLDRRSVVHEADRLRREPRERAECGGERRVDARDVGEVARGEAVPLAFEARGRRAADAEDDGIAVEQHARERGAQAARVTASPLSSEMPTITASWSAWWAASLPRWRNR